MAESTEERTLLPLDAPRVVSLKTKTTAYTWKLRRVTGDDWAKFFAAGVHQLLQADGRRERVVESEAAMVELVDRVVLSADGYGDLTAVRDWKAALPLRHRVAVGMVLRSVAAEIRPTAAICDLVEIPLTATWPTDGKSVAYTGLIHRFRHPSAEQLKRFNFEASRVEVRGTAENGVSVFPSRQAIAMKIYDDLIESVDGYSANGEPLADIAAIQREMDGAHKAAAALELFLGDEEVEIE